MAMKKKKNKKACAMPEGWGEEESKACTEEEWSAREAEEMSKRMEQERLEREHMERERLERERVEQERLDRERTSPYTSSVITLLVGPEQKRYYVPQRLLQSPRWITFCSEATEIHLPDVDESTAHVLVHYLYTSTYQLLNEAGIPSDQETHIKFKRATLVYFAAQKYELAGVQQLAIQEIERYSTKMDILDVVKIIDEDFSKLSGDSQFEGFLDKRIQVAFEEDHTTFSRDDFFGCINNAALNKILMKCVVKLYTDKLSRVLDTEKESFQRVPEELIPNDRSLPVEEQAAEDSVLPADEPITLVKETPLVEELHYIEEAQPTEETAVGPEEAVEEAVAEPTAEPEEAAAEPEEPILEPKEPAPEPEEPEVEIEAEPEEPAPEPQEPAPEPEEPAPEPQEPAPEPEEPAEEAPAEEPAANKFKFSMSFNDTGRTGFGFGSLSSWNSGWGGNKASWGSGTRLDAEAEPSAEPEPETAPTEEVRDSPWGKLEVSSKSKKKKKKGCKGAVEEPPPPPPPGPEPEPKPVPVPVPEPVPEPAPIPERRDHGWWTYSEVKLKKAGCSPPPLPEPESEPVLDGWGPGARFGVIPKKTGCLPQSQPEPEPEPVPAQEMSDDSWGDGALSFGVEKKKKEKKNKGQIEQVAETPPPPTPLPPPQAMPETASAREMSDVSWGSREFHSEPEICPVRNSHLFEGDAWKHCSQCRALMRQVAIRIARAGYADTDGYEIVDSVLTG